MRKFFAAVLATTSLLGHVTQAEVQKAPQNGRMIVRLCMEEQGEVAGATCRGFVAGMIDITRLYASSKSLQPSFCVPPETSPDEAVAVYRKYLKENRSMKHFPAAALALTAFKKAYPCE